MWKIGRTEMKWNRTRAQQRKESERREYERPAQFERTEVIEASAKSQPDFLGIHFGLQQNRNGEIVQRENESKCERIENCRAAGWTKDIAQQCCSAKE